MAQNMKVGLIQVDGKMPNLALMKLSAWHKKRGDQVTLIDLSHLSFDRIYGSKIFMGGSGFDLKSELPAEIELEYPDYDLFKLSKGKRIGFTSRGCIRDCGFCIVKEKEGQIREMPFDWVDGADRLVILDNNFLASPKWKEKLEYFTRARITKGNRHYRLRVCFTQGLDIRLVNAENAKLLAQTLYSDLKFRKRRLYFAFDNPQLEPQVRRGIALLNDAGILSEHLMFYVLVGFDTNIKQDLHRIGVLASLGCLPFVMIFNNKPDAVLHRLARWVNKRYYRVVPWEKFMVREERREC